MKKVSVLPIKLIDTILQQKQIAFLCHIEYANYIADQFYDYFGFVHN